MSEASDLIDHLKNIADDSFLKSSQAAAQLFEATVTQQTNLYARDLTQYRDVNAPVVPNIGEAPDPDELMVDFDAALDQVKGVVDSLQDSWLMQYFPATMPDGFDPLMQQILNGELITAAEQEILWERAKQQAMRDSLRAESEAVSEWASRGFSLPGGVIAGRLETQQQNLFFANADLAAQQAIKAIDLRVDAVKFAADVGTRLRLGLIGALTQLVDAYARLPAAAADYASAVANAKRAAYEAVAAYYRALIDGSDLTLRAGIANASNDMAYINAAGAFIGTAVGHQVEAVVAETNVYAQTAAASLSGLNGVASVVNQTIE
jgi:hypothetical protein